MITPELFDLYDMDRKPRGTRTKTLVVKHPGYQAIKTIFAQHSLRSWRTYGVSGIIFNAENWDFKDGEKVMPVMKALARYFGDTDLYIAGPGKDWPSKDHCFFSGEAVCKQVVLLNDLTRDIPCLLEWRLKDERGKAFAAGRINAVSRAGTPTMYPVEFSAPSVTRRTDYTLTVEIVAQPRDHFKPESFAITVFPPRQPAPAEQKVLVFDPVGETTRMLKHARLEAAPLAEHSDLNNASVLIVGKKSYGDAFLSLAKKAGLEEAVRNGLNLLVFEQTATDVLGLKLHEESTRHAFVARPDHPFLNALEPGDFINLRGQSDLIAPYPDAPPETEKEWPKRYFKWGNRGVVATFAYTKPHYGPYTPILQCGFDLVDSPLLEARIGKGRIALCSVDVTARYGTDPVSTQLVDNLIEGLGHRSPPAPGMRIANGNSADIKDLERAAHDGATILLMPNSPASAAFGLKTREERFFIGRINPNPLLDGLTDGDLYLKHWTTMPVACSGDGWEIIAEPGLVAVKRLGKGRLVACQLDLQRLGQGRDRIKALRFWNILQNNIGLDRPEFQQFLHPSAKFYEPNAWEQIPPCINW